MMSHEAQKIYVKPLTTATYENQSASVTTSGFSDTASTLEWFKERLHRVATMDTVTKAELEYAVKYYEVLAIKRISILFGTVVSLISAILMM